VLDGFEATPQLAPSRELEPVESEPANEGYATAPSDRPAPGRLGSAEAEHSASDADEAGSPTAARSSSASASKPAAENATRGRPLEKRRQREDRPGLGTHWGETRYSPAHQVDFERADARRPNAVVELHYNDRTGARRMLPGGYGGSAETRALGLRFRVLDAAGRTLPALVDGARVVGVGAPGERYTLSIESSSASRFEIVASVDGLDVIDGESASFEKRGYLVGAYGSIVIDGFRRSGAEVAAFRLGDVARSYAASKGKARNVGVIGIALFEERRPVIEPWRDPIPLDDTRQRQNADPFPGRFARPPVW
jgi:hypothetical protein